MVTQKTFILSAVPLAALLINAAAMALPPSPQFIPHTPDTSGMPGQGTVMFANFAPGGELWVSSNTAGLIWLYGGIGVYDATTDIWITHSSRSTPLQFWNYEVEWDSQGNAWLACENQLVMKQAESGEWQVFGPLNSPLVGDRNWDVAIDGNDHIWIANDDIDQVQGGLFEFDPALQSWMHHDEPFMRTYFGISAPFSVYARSNGEIWAAFEFMSGNARRVNGQWLHQTGPQILQFAETSDGTLYGVSGSGTYRFNDATQSWDVIAGYNSSVIAIDSQDRVYVGSGAFTYRFANGAWTVFAEAPSDIKSVDFDAAGDVWIAYKHSVRQYDDSGSGKRIYSSVMTGIGYYNLDNIEVDNQGNVWTMAGTTGATRFDGERYRNFSQFGHEETNPFQLGSSLLCTNVEDVFQDSAGNIWFAANGVARSADLENWDLWYWGNANLPYDHLTAIGQDANGAIWAGSDGSGIFRFDELSGQWIHRSLGANYNAERVIEIVTTTGGVMWVATYAGVHRFDGTNWSYFPAWSAEVPSMPRDLAAGPNGDVWIATGDGLVHHDGASAWTVYTPANSALMHPNVSSVAVREDGLVAACSEDLYYNYPYTGNMVLFDSTTAEWAGYPGGYGNPNPFYQASAMEFDHRGDLWIAEVNFGAVQVLLGGGQVVPGDIDGDGDVDLADGAVLVDVLLGLDIDPQHAAQSDINQDGTPNGLDIQPFLDAMLQS